MSLQGILGVMNLSCKYKIIQDFNSSRYCYIDELPLANSTTGNIHFHVDYASPSDIERMRFRASVGYLPQQIFAYFPNLQYLDISSTHLGELNPGDFTHAMNLQKLDLAENRLTVIKSNTFLHDSTAAPLQKLKILYLSLNRISEIEANAFNGLTNLVELSLQFNQVTTIRRETFVGMPSLQTLHLDENQIGNIEDDAFNLPELIDLDLSANKLKTLSDVVFVGVPKLTKLQLEFNELEHIGRSLHGLSQVKRIILASNYIRDIDLAEFTNLPRLKKLDLGRSGFKFATTHLENVHQYNSSLKMLRINGNELTDATELNKLEIFPNLTDLYIGENGYWDLDVGNGRTLRDILPVLETVYLCDIETSDNESIRQTLLAANIKYSYACRESALAADD